MKKFTHFIAALLISWALATVAYGTTLVSLDSNATKGSGFVVAVSSEGPPYSIVATNYHICVENYKEVMFNKAKPKLAEFKVYDNDSIKPVTFVAALPFADLCLLKTEGHYKPLPLARNLELAPKELLKVFPGRPLGNPVVSYYGPDNESDEWSAIHIGSHKARGKCLPGMSGSPVMSKNRVVVGVLWGCTSKTKKKQHFTYFIEIEKLNLLLKRLDSHYIIWYD